MRSSPYLASSRTQQDMSEPMPVAIPEHLASLIINSATNFAIVTLDPQDVITSWNIGAERLMQWTAR